MSRNRVVVTGMGWCTPLGCELQTAWKALLAGQSGIDLIKGFDTSRHDVKFGGEVRDFDISAARRGRPTGSTASRRYGEFGQAVQDAGIDFDRCDRTRVGVIVGSGIGGLIETEEQHRRCSKGPGGYRRSSSPNS